MISNTESFDTLEILGSSCPHSSSPLKSARPFQAHAIQSPRLFNPSNPYIKHKALNLMGAVVGCLGLSSHYIKKLREKKEGGASKSRARVESVSPPLSPFAASQAGAQSPSVQDAQRGLQDEHLATVPPTVEPGGESRTETEAAGTLEVTRGAASTARVPTPTA
jgi:hypothetical protein